MSLRWKKKLSKSDAQVKTRGWPVPYIRLTRSGHVSNTQTWFRNTFFQGVSWKPGRFGEHAVEQTKVRFDVKLPGQSVETRKLLVTHNATRGQTGKNTPNTWIHWDDDTRDELRENNYAGRTIILKRTKSSFLLTIT